MTYSPQLQLIFIDELDYLDILDNARESRMNVYLSSEDKFQITSPQFEQLNSPIISQIMPVQKQPLAGEFTSFNSESLSTNLAATTNGIVVTTFADVINPMDGLISLREAILANNNSPGNNTIVLGAGTYTLNLQGAGAEVGDFDILANLNIVGLGAGSTIINANSIDRTFEVSPNVALKLSDLTITNGLAAGANGGAIYNQGTVNLSKVTVSNIPCQATAFTFLKD